MEASSKGLTGSHINLKIILQECREWGEVDSTGCWEIGQERPDQERGMIKGATRAHDLGWRETRLKIQKLSQLWTNYLWGLRKVLILGWNQCFWLDISNSIRANRFLEKENEKSISGMWVWAVSGICRWSWQLVVAYTDRTSGEGWEFEIQESNHIR